MREKEIYKIIFVIYENYKKPLDFKNKIITIY